MRRELRQCGRFFVELLLSAVWVGQLVVEQIRQLVEESEIMKEDDAKWPKKNVVGRQELEIRIGNEHISFEVRPFHQNIHSRMADVSAYMTDCQAGVFGRGAGLRRPRRSPCLLLSGAGSEGAS